MEASEGRYALNYEIDLSEMLVYEQENDIESIILRYHYYQDPEVTL